MTRPRSDHLLPRIIRFLDAPHYLGMDRNRFNAEVRPNLTEIPIGEQGIGSDRLDLDAWADDYKFRNGRPRRWKGDKIRILIATTRLSALVQRCRSRNIVGGDTASNVREITIEKSRYRSAGVSGSGFLKLEGGGLRAVLGGTP
jgi:hypothetical protein